VSKWAPVFVFFFLMEPSHSFAEDLSVDDLKNKIVAAKLAQDQRQAVLWATRIFEQNELDPYDVREALNALDKADGLTPELASAMAKHLGSELQAEISAGGNAFYRRSIPSVLGSLIEKESQKEKSALSKALLSKVEQAIHKSRVANLEIDRDQIELLFGIGRQLAKGTSTLSPESMGIVASHLSSELGEPVTSADASALFFATPVAKEHVQRLGKIVENEQIELWKTFSRRAALDRLASLADAEAVKVLLQAHNTLKKRDFAREIAEALVLAGAEEPKKDRLVNPQILQSLVLEYEKRTSAQGFLKRAMGYFSKLETYSLSPGERAAIEKLVERIIRRTFVIAMNSARKAADGIEAEKGDSQVLHNLAVKTAFGLIKAFNLENEVDQLIEKANRDRTNPKVEDGASWRRHQPGGHRDPSTHSRTS
jgi:hypothetical protein